jgi:hypothetical protein
MSSTTAHRISLLFGLVVLALALVGAFQPAPPVCGALSANYAPIIAFELARSVSDLHAIFGALPDACRGAMAAHMDTINLVDSFVFIPAYGLFLVFFFLGRSSTSRRLAYAAVLVAVIACLADYAENFALFNLSPNPDDPVWIPMLVGATETKWTALGVAGVAAIPLVWNGWLGWLAVLTGGIGLAAAAMSVPAPALIGPYLSNAIALSWLLFLAVDVRESLRPSRGAT